MKFLVVLAVIFAIAAIGFLVATMFVGGNNVIYPSIGAGLSLVA